MFLSCSTACGSDGAVIHTTFMKLATLQRFDDIIDKLEDPRIRDDTLEAWLYDNSGQSNESCASLRQFMGMTPLHMVMPCRPPVKLVDALISRLSRIRPSLFPEDATDIQGRTPLHIAAASACDSAVVDRLLDGVSVAMPAIIKDNQQRYALHWACANPHGIGNKDFTAEFNSKLLRRAQPNRYDEASEQNMSQVIATLVDANPEAVMVQDAFGLTPLDLAKQNDADEAIILFLQKATQQHGHVPTVSTKNTDPADVSATRPIPIEITHFNHASFPERNKRSPITDEHSFSSVGMGGISQHVKKKNHLPSCSESGMLEI